MGGDYTRFTDKPPKRYSGVLMQQGRVQLDADWNEEIEIVKRRWQTQAADTFGHCAVPKATTPDAFKVAGPGLTLGVGRMYVDGLAPEIFDGETFSYTQQPFYPAPPALPPSGNAVVYIDVWDREVTYIEDPELLEKALGGPDTTTRWQTVWQVKVQGMGTNPVTCNTGLDALFPPSAGRLSSRAIAPPASDDPCIISPGGGYRGLENRLYRIEVHTAGDLTTARFKWSRENASVVSAVEDISTSGGQSRLTVSRIGRDKVLRFQVDDWVEVLDDHRELMGEPGEMARITKIDEASRRITLDRAIPAAGTRAFGSTGAQLAARHTRLRRWDQQRDIVKVAGVDTGLVAVSNTWLALEDGLEVRFALNPAAGQFHVGDYWVVAARTADASVDTFVDAPPRGIVHHYCQLATLTGLPTPTIGDCRPLWPPAAGEGCCTISVGDGVLSKGQFQNLAAAIASIATGTIPVRVCLLPGNHTVNQTITISRNDVTITGCARASRVAAEGTAFIVAGDGISFENFLLETRATLPAITWTGAGGRIRGLDLNAPGPGIITTNARDFLVLESRIAALPSISLLGQNQIVARTRMRNGGLEIRGGSAGVWVFENHISQGDGNGITLGGARGGEPSPILRNIAIEHNYITGMVESGIAGAAASAAGGGARSGTLGLSITENIIDNCVSERAAARPDGLPHGGIILDNVRRVLVRHNRIESNGNRSKAPVCGVFAARAGGIDIVDNHVLNNGAPPGTIQERRNQGGIVALDVFPAASAIPSSDPTGAGPAITRLVASPLAARVTGNVVITPGTLALNLQGTGSMQVAGNRLVSQNNPGLPGLDAVNAALKAFATDPELSVGAVLIINFGLAPYLAALLAGQGFNARKVSASFSAGGAAPPPELAGGAIQFSGNQVLLEMRPAAQPNFQVTGVLVVTLDDLIAAANQTESRLAQTFQLFDTMDLAVTARVPANGYAENIGQCGFSLVSMGFLMSTGVDNQATHCILITGPAARTVNKDNLSLACRLAAAPVFGARAAGGG